jgi:formate dehydrogenase major subunit
MTNTWQDIKNANVVVDMGGNAAEAHPCGFKWVIEAKIENDAKLVVVDPRFTRTASVADIYAPIRPGTDIAFLNGLIRYLLENDTIQHDYVRAYTNASLIVKEGFGFEDGLFSGYREDSNSYDRSSWDYELDEQGFAKIDDTLRHPRCVMNLLRKHVDRYTPEMVSRICGTPQDKYLQICKLFATTAAPDKALTSLFALGWTQHSVGSQNIRAMAMVQLLLGNIGVAGGGMNALRGHSNIQGLTDVGLMSDQMPGYLSLPREIEPTFEDYMKTRQFRPLRPGQTSYWQNYRKFIVSFQKAIYGDAARADNDWAYDWLPKLDVPLYDIIRAFDMMANGEMNGYICQGFNPLQAFPDRGKIRRLRGSGRILVPRIRRIRPASRPRSSSSRRPASPRRTARSSIRPAGCNGIGKRPTRRGKPSPTSGSWPRFSIGCAKCTARKAAHSPIRFSIWLGTTPIRPTRIRRSWQRT